MSSLTSIKIVDNNVAHVDNSMNHLIYSIQSTTVETIYAWLDSLYSKYTKCQSCQ